MSNINKLDDSMYKGYKLRIYPTEEQEREFRKYFGMVRFVYNLGKDVYESYYKENKDNPNVKRKTLSFEKLDSTITQLKKQPKYSWLNGYSSKSIEIVLMDLINGYRMFYNKATNQLPKYKTKRNANQSFPTRKDRMSILGNQLWLSSFKNDPILIKKVPKKLQGFGSNEIDDEGTSNRTDKYKDFHYLEYCNPRISYDGIHYYISFTLKRCDDTGKLLKDYNYASTKKFKYNKEWDSKPSSDIVGYDFGCRYDNWFVGSNGKRLRRPNQTKKEKQIAGLQTKLARQQRINKKKQLTRTSQYTKNEEKTLKRYNKAIKKHVNQRKNIMHNFISKVIASKPEAVVLETLSAKDMEIEGANEHNKNVKYSMPYRFINTFKYKCEANGIPVIFAPEGFKSTKTCSRCGYEYKIGNTRTYKCPQCHLKIDRDLNAAKNLRNYGYDVLHGFDNVNSLNVA